MLKVHRILIMWASSFVLLHPAHPPPPQIITWVSGTGLGQVQLKLGDFRSALTNFEKVLEIYPDNCETLKVSYDWKGVTTCVSFLHLFCDFFSWIFYLLDFSRPSRHLDTFTFSLGRLRRPRNFWGRLQRLIHVMLRWFDFPRRLKIW